MSSAGGARNKNIRLRIASVWMNRIVSRATGVRLRDYGCMLRLYSRAVVLLMRECGETSSFIPALADCFTDRMVEIPVEHAERNEGKVPLFVAQTGGATAGFADRFFDAAVARLVGGRSGPCGLRHRLCLLLLILEGCYWDPSGPRAVYSRCLRFCFSLWAVSLLLSELWVNTSGGFMTRFGGDRNL